MQISLILFIVDLGSGQISTFHIGEGSIWLEF